MSRTNDDHRSALSTPPPESDNTVVVARVIGAHGRDGGLNIQLLSDVPGRFDAGQELLIDSQPRRISSSRQTGSDTALIWFEGVSSRQQATPLAGRFLSASPGDTASLEDGEYFHYQLIGMSVRTEEGEELGELREILETGSNDVYIVRGPGGEILIPATAHVVLDVDVAGGSMTVRLPDGLR